MYTGALYRSKINRGPHRSASGANGRLVLRDLLGSQTVLLRQVGHRVHTFGRQLRVELEGLEVQLGLYFVLDPVQRHLQGPQANGTPGAGHIGHKIDFQSGSHGASSQAV